eukprot:Partr_v1_DN28431_c1_g1_i1_m41884 putative Inherit from opiNOG: patatin-like phospholipase domain containing 8
MAAAPPPPIFAWRDGLWEPVPLAAAPGVPSSLRALAWLVYANADRDANVLALLYMGSVTHTSRPPASWSVPGYNFTPRELLGPAQWPQRGRVVILQQEGTSLREHPAHSGAAVVAPTETPLVLLCTGVDTYVPLRSVPRCEYEVPAPTDGVQTADAGGLAADSGGDGANLDFSARNTVRCASRALALCLSCDSPKGTWGCRACLTALHARVREHQIVGLDAGVRYRKGYAEATYRADEGEFEADIDNAICRLDWDKRMVVTPRLYQLRESVDGDQHAPVIAFVGDTGSGKSTLMRACAVFAPGEPRPLSGVANGVATSADVNAYVGSLGATVPTAIFLDPEGTEASDVKPALAVSSYLGRTARRFAGLWVGNTQVGTEQWESDYMKHHMQLVENTYPRLLYLFSDVIVYVFGDQEQQERLVLAKLRAFAAGTITAVKPYVVLVFNKKAQGTVIDGNVDTTTSAWRERTAAWGELQRYFADVAVVHVPQRSDYTVFSQQTQRLADKIVEFTAASIARRSAHGRLLPHTLWVSLFSKCITLLRPNPLRAIGNLADLYPPMTAHVSWVNNALALFRALCAVATEHHLRKDAVPAAAPVGAAGGSASPATLVWARTRAWADAYDFVSLLVIDVFLAKRVRNTSGSGGLAAFTPQREVDSAFRADVVKLHRLLVGEMPCGSTFDFAAVANPAVACACAKRRGTGESGEAPLHGPRHKDVKSFFRRWDKANPLLARFLNFARKFFNGEPCEWPLSAAGRDDDDSAVDGGDGGSDEVDAFQVPVVEGLDLQHYLVADGDGTQSRLTAAFYAALHDPSLLPTWPPDGVQVRSLLAKRRFARRGTLSGISIGGACVGCLVDVVTMALSCRHTLCAACLGDAMLLNKLVECCVCEQTTLMAEPGAVLPTSNGTAKPSQSDAAAVGALDQLVGYRALALDSSGTRAAYQLALVAQLSSDLGGLPVTEMFDLIVGENVGGVAALLLKRFPAPQEAYDAFVTLARDHIKEASLFGMLRSWLLPEELAAGLQAAFGDEPLYSGLQLPFVVGSTVRDDKSANFMRTHFVDHQHASVPPSSHVSSRLSQVAQLLSAVHPYLPATTAGLSKEEWLHLSREPGVPPCQYVLKEGSAAFPGRHCDTLVSVGCEVARVFSANSPSPTVAVGTAEATAFTAAKGAMLAARGLPAGCALRLDAELSVEAPRTLAEVAEQSTTSALTGHAIVRLLPQHLAQISDEVRLVASSPAYTAVAQRVFTTLFFFKRAEAVEEDAGDGVRLLGRVYLRPPPRYLLPRLQNSLLPPAGSPPAFRVDVRQYSAAESRLGNVEANCGVKVGRPNPAPGFNVDEPMSLWWDVTSHNLQLAGQLSMEIHCTVPFSPRLGAAASTPIAGCPFVIFH